MHESLNDRDIGKLTIYARGRVCFDAHQWERAYQEFFGLYSQDPDYEDVATLCAEAAYNNAAQTEIPTNCKHQVEWLERATAIDPKHREGRTQSQLDTARYELAKDLLGANDVSAAVEQIDKISARFRRKRDVRLTLAKACLVEGDREFKRLNFATAVGWWKQALAISQSQKGALREQLRKAKTFVWIWDHSIFILAGVLLVSLAVCLAAWSCREGAVWLAMVGPTPTNLTLMPTATPTALATKVPSETQKPSTPTFTTIPSSTPTLLSSPTHTRTPTPTSTRTPAPTPIALLPAPKLIKPGNDSNWSGYIQFEWTWDGNLGEDNWYAVRAWPEGELSPGHSKTWTQDMSWETGDLGPRGGWYRSHVVVLSTWHGSKESCKPFNYEEGKDRCYREISKRSEERRFYYTAPSSPSCAPNC